MIERWPLRTEAAYLEQVRARAGAALTEQLARIRLVVMDCDGVLTDGTLHFGPEGEVVKVFDAQDGLGLMMLRAASVQRAVLTGRVSPMVERRCRELAFEAIMMQRFDKLCAFEEILAATGVPAHQTLYIGDDLLDLPPMLAAAIAVTVPAAPAEVRDTAALVTRAEGGRGAVREVCDLVLKSRGAFSSAIRALAAQGPPHPVAAAKERC